MLLYRVKSGPSMLLPDACATEWTDLTRVFSDAAPMPAGVGATQIAQQALGLSPSDAANLVAAGGNGSVSAAQLAAIVSALRPKPTGRGANAVRVPIPADVNTNLPLINGDPLRTFLIVQNNNASGGANLLVSVDGTINTGTPAFYLNLAPTFGILLDEEIFINPLYVAWGTGTVIGGMILFGSSAAAAPAPIQGGEIMASIARIQ